MVTDYPAHLELNGEEISKICRFEGGRCKKQKKNEIIDDCIILSRNYSLEAIHINKTVKRICIITVGSIRTVAVTRDTGSEKRRTNDQQVN